MLELEQIRSIKGHEKLRNFQAGCMDAWLTVSVTSTLPSPLARLPGLACAWAILPLLRGVHLGEIPDG